MHKIQIFIMKLTADGLFDDVDHTVEQSDGLQIFAVVCNRVHKGSVDYHL